MRLLVLVAVTALAAGCVGPESGEPTGTLLGYCPQWMAGPGQFDGTLDLNGTEDLVVAIEPASLVHAGKDLDIYRLRLGALNVSGGQLELRAFTEGNASGGRNWYDYRSAGQPFQSVPVLIFRAGGNETGREFDVLLSALPDAEPAAPAPLRLEWRFVPDGPQGRAIATYSVSFHYRVCGAAP